MQHKDSKTLHKFSSYSQFYEVHIIYVRKPCDRSRELSEINHRACTSVPRQTNLGTIDGIARHPEKSPGILWILPPSPNGAVSELLGR